MEPLETRDRPGGRDVARGYADADLNRNPPRIVKAMSLIMVLALILAGSSVIIFNTDNGLIIVLLLVAIAALLVFVWGFRSRNGEPGTDR